MEEIKLTEPVATHNKTKKRLYVIKNDKGFYLRKNKPYWTTDLNECLSELRTRDFQINHARDLLKTREEYDSGKSKCFNTDLYMSFSKLFIQEVSVVEEK